MYSVYQGAVYQSYVYQRDDSSSTPVVETETYSGGYKESYAENLARRQNQFDVFFRNPRKVDDLIPEQVPEVVKQAIVDVVDIQDKKKREKKFRFELSGVDQQNLSIYLAYLERVYSDWLDEKLRIEMLKRQQSEDDEMILLLLMSEV